MGERLTDDGAARLTGVSLTVGSGRLTGVSLTDGGGRLTGVKFTVDAAA